ncbi:MAG: cbb3-type cytochrome oxidase assembly protein CcoS [Bacteroidia bacterium]
MYLLIGVSILLASGFLMAFIWSVKSGQMEDEYTPGLRILFDDDLKTPKTESENTENKPIEKN